MFNDLLEIRRSAAPIRKRYPAELPRCRRGLSLTLAATLSIAAQTIWLTSAVHAQAPTSDLYAFTVLSPNPNFGDGDFRLSGITGDIAVGYSTSTIFNGTQASVALRWNADGTRTNLNSLANLGNLEDAQARGIENGVIIGYGKGGNTSNRYDALRWNADGTVTNLHAIANLGTTSTSQAVAIADGVIVGNGRGNNTFFQNNALRWNADGTVTNLHSALELFPDENSFATGTSGGAVVGYYNDEEAGLGARAVRWNADGTVTNLHSLLYPDATISTPEQTFATGISDGVTVGYRFDNGVKAVRWNADNSVTDLSSFVKFGTNTVTYATAIGGGISVGYGGGADVGFVNYNALRWNADGTSLNLQQFVNGTTYSIATTVDAATGNIGGFVYTAASKSQAAYWTPLNAGGGGANSLSVHSGITTTINQNFTQNAGETNVNGILALNDANTANGKETFTLAGGSFGGAGTLTGNLVNTGGTVSPGNSPGTLTVDGDYSQSGTGVLKIEIASLSDFDVLNILGDASLGGTLDISFLGAFEPNLGDSVDFLNVTGEITGIFDTINITGGNLDARDLAARLDSTPNGFKLSMVSSVVPESSSLSLLTLAIPALGACIARRKIK